MKILEGRTTYMTAPLWKKVDEMIERLALKTHGRLGMAGYMYMLTLDDDAAIKMLQIVDEHIKNCKEIQA